VLALDSPSHVLVLLGDQPFVTADTVSRLLQAGLRHPRAAAVGLARAEAGQDLAIRPPLLLHRSLLPQILELEGDQGARRLLARHAGSLVTVPAQELELLDLDTPLDLERARAVLEKGRSPG
jgi:molybdenum cofactor cytidylyltransferase